MGIPAGAVQQALQKEGKDPSVINMDPEKPYSTQMKVEEKDDGKKLTLPLKDDPEYAKFFKVCCDLLFLLLCNITFVRDCILNSSTLYAWVRCSKWVFQLVRCKMR